MSLLSSIGDWLLGNRNESTQQNLTTTKNENVQRQQIQSQSGASAQQQGRVGAGTTTQTTLDPETLATINALIKGQASGIGNNNIASIMASRAATAPQDYSALVAPIISRARVTGERELGAQITDIAQRTGTRMDTTLQELQSIGRTDLETSLAGKEAELLMAARQAGTAEQGAATAAQSTGMRDIAVLLDAIKGGQISGTQRTEEQQTTNEAQILTQILEELSSGTSVSVADGSTSGRKTGTALDWLSALSSFNPNRGG